MVSVDVKHHVYLLTFYSELMSYSLVYHGTDSPQTAGRQMAVSTPGRASRVSNADYYFFNKRGEKLSDTPLSVHFSFHTFQCGL